MEKKKIKDLTQGELLYVFDVNSKLRKEVLEEYISSQKMFVHDVIADLKDALEGFDVSAGTVRIKNGDLFLDKLIALQENYNFFEDFSVIGKYLENAKKHFIFQDGGNIFMDRISQALDTIKEILGEPKLYKVEKYFITDFSTYLDDTFYVDKHYVLYKTYTKCYI